MTGSLDGSAGSGQRSWRYLALIALYASIALCALGRRWVELLAWLATTIVAATGLGFTPASSSSVSNPLFSGSVSLPVSVMATSVIGCSGSSEAGVAPASGGVVF